MRKIIKLLHIFLLMLPFGLSAQNISEDISRNNNLFNHDYLQNSSVLKNDSPEYSFFKNNSFACGPLPLAKFSIPTR